MGGLARRARAAAKGHQELDPPLLGYMLLIELLQSVELMVSSAAFGMARFATPLYFYSIMVEI
jgi:hypothetical protein